MKEQIGNIWNFPADYRCILTNCLVKTNGELCMGGGNALEAVIKYPKLSKILGNYQWRYGDRCFLIKEYSIISFPTKYHPKDKSDLILIDKSCQQLKQIVDKFKINNISICRPGCGLGGLLWENVKPILEKHLDDRFTVFSF